MTTLSDHGAAEMAAPVRNEASLAKIDGMLETLRHHAHADDDDDTVRDACDVLHTLDEAELTDFAARGGVKALLGALARHTDDLLLWEAACGSLEFAASIPAVALEIAREGGVDLLVGVLKQYAGHESVVGPAWLALAEIGAYDATAPFIASAGVVALLGATLAEDGRWNTDLVTELCTAVTMLARVERHAAALGRGVIARLFNLLDLLEWNVGDDDVLMACAALRNMAACGANAAIIAEGGIEPLLRAVRRLEDTGGRCDEVAQVLDALLLHPASAARVRAAGYTAAEPSAARAAPLGPVPLGPVPLGPVPLGPVPLVPPQGWHAPSSDDGALDDGAMDKEHAGATGGARAGPPPAASADAPRAVALEGGALAASLLGGCAAAATTTVQIGRVLWSAFTPGAEGAMPSAMIHHVAKHLVPLVVGVTSGCVGIFYL